MASVAISEADVTFVKKTAKGNAIKKFLRGSPLGFDDAIEFWGITSRTRDPIARASVVSDRISRVVNSFGDYFDPRLPPLSTCYGLLNLNRLMRSRFEKEIAALADSRASRSPIRNRHANITEHLTVTTTKKNRASKRAAGNVSPLVGRMYTNRGEDPFKSVKFEKRDSAITNPDGTVVSSSRGVDIPESWSQLATDIVVSKYFRRAGLFGDATMGETSVQQVIYRIARTIREAGVSMAYFASDEEAETFESELAFLLVNQYGAFNSPVWFNLGLFQRYGITGSGGNWAWDDATGTVKETTNAYERPQCSACQPYHALVSTERGLLPIGRIVTENMVGLRVCDGDGLTEVKAVKMNGAKPVYRVTLADGFEIDATGDHLVCAHTKRRAKDHEWVRVDRLSDGMYMRVYPRANECVSIASDLGVSEAALAGWLQTDGFVGQYQAGTNTSLTIELITINDDERAWVESHVDRVFPGVHRHVSKETVEDQSVDFTRIRLYGEQLRAFVERYDLLTRNPSMKVPDAIYRASDEEVVAYLRSVFQADGYVSIRDTSARIGVSKCSREMMKGVQRLLARVGCYSRLLRKKEKRADRYDQWCVTIGTLSERRSFADRIGFIGRVKSAKLDQSLQMEGLESAAVQYVPIERIEVVGEVDVYDIQTASGRYLTGGGVLVHNCFIQPVEDDLMSIYQLVQNEARLFKWGSGTGTNFSNIRGRQEKLSGGGTSSGLISFLEVFDRAAGATKSGGTTRRAAKLVCLDMDHPEIVDFIEWKSREEKKAHALIAAGYPSDFNGEAYRTVSGQNSNNSVRVTDAFMNAVDSDGGWQTRMRTTGNVCETFKARDLWRKVAEAAWRCADPAVMYDTTINDWHTCPNTGPIRAANPCVEFHFLDSTSCNLSSLNLTKFLRDLPNGEIDFDVEGYRHAARVFFVAQEILVDLGSYPTKDIAQNSHDYRPLGLGYANLGTLLMVMGLPYDSDAGRSVASSLTAIMTGHAYRVSAEMAAIKGTFAGYAKNREPMLRVMRKHRDAAYKIDANGPLPGILRAAREEWDEAVRLGEKYGYRNAQASVLAPTGTIGLLMDCDTTGIEPDFSIVKYKKLAGGGYFKIVNASVERALKRLSYTAAQSAEIIAYVAGTNSFAAAPVINREYLKNKGFSDADVERVEAALPGSFTIDGAFTPHVLGADLIKRLGVEDESKTKEFSLLAKWGLSRTEIDTLGDHVLGRSTVEGAPHLRAEHYAVFDCANRCGKHGTRFIAPLAHLKMMAAAQPFIAGAISKTVNVPNEATVEEIAYIYREGWKLGLKAVALYRDGCKASQPLSSSGDKAQSGADGSSKKAETKTEVPVAPTATAPINSPRSASVRHRLPRKRFGFTLEARVAGHKVFLRTGDYEDGKLGEIFIDMHKEGASFRSLVNCLAISVSMGLQHGIKLEEYVDQFTFTRFEPHGPVEGHASVKFATSIVDYVFRVLAVEYLNRHDLAHVQPDEHAVSASTDATSTHPVAAETRAPTSNPTLGKMMGDAPFCDGCGHVTVRNGTCYRCLNCGNSMGCS